MRKASHIGAVLAPAVLLFCIYPSLAQTPPKPKPNLNRPANADREYAYEKLTAPVDFPSVPPYSGNKIFLSGLKYPNDATGKRVGLTYGVNEDDQTILNWYKNALSQYQWKVQNFSPNSSSLVASKAGNTFSLRVQPSTAKGYRNIMVMSLKEHSASRQ